MSQNNFIKLFGVEVLHTYFATNQCACLQFIPEERSEKIIRKFGFRMNKKANGFELFFQTNTSIPTLLNYISKTTTVDYFEFFIKSITPNFSLFTALPIHFLGQINYASKDDKNQNEKGIVVLNETFETKQSSSFLGCLRVYFTDIQKSQANNPIQYQILFKARTTQWHYYIINKNAVVLNGPIIAQKGKSQFEGPKKVTLQTGEKALLFTSNDKAIPLSENPKYQFDLIDKNESNSKNSTTKTIIKALPVPDVSRIGISEETAKHQVISPMYIYL